MKLTLTKKLAKDLKAMEYLEGFQVQHKLVVEVRHVETSTQMGEPKEVTVHYRTLNGDSYGIVAFNPSDNVYVLEVR